MKKREGHEEINVAIADCSSIPTGLRNKAQGCEARATLGNTQ